MVIIDISDSNTTVWKEPKKNIGGCIEFFKFDAFGCLIN